MAINPLNIFWGMILILLLGFSAGAMIGYQLTRYLDMRRGLKPMSQKDLDDFLANSNQHIRVNGNFQPRPRPGRPQHPQHKLFPFNWQTAQLHLEKAIREGQTWTCHCESCLKVRLHLADTGRMDTWEKGIRERVGLTDRYIQG